MAEPEFPFVLAAASLLPPYWVSPERSIVTFLVKGPAGAVITIDEAAAASLPSVNVRSKGRVVRGVGVFGSVVSVSFTLHLFSAVFVISTLIGWALPRS